MPRGSPGLSKACFSLKYVQMNVMDLRRHVILLEEGLHNINVHEEWLVDFGSDDIFGEDEQDGQIVHYDKI